MYEVSLLSMMEFMVRQYTSDNWGVWEEIADYICGMID